MSPIDRAHTGEGGAECDLRTLGIDLSADPRKTGACVIDWQEPTVRFLDRRISDEELVVAISNVDMAAIDVPFGWPDPFVDALVAHRAGEPWPPAGAAPPENRRPLRFREIDRVVQARGAMPLSVSTDRMRRHVQPHRRDSRCAR